MAANSGLAPSLNQFQNTFTIKLTPNNYLAWKTQFVPLLHYHNLYGFVDGSSPSPPETIIDVTSKQSIPNPKYKRWFHNDQMLLTWLLSSLTEDVFPYVVGLTSSQQVWTALANAFGSISHSQQVQIHIQLQELRPDDKGIAHYLQRAKTLSNELSLAGKPLSQAEFNAIIYRSLGPEYHSLIAALNLQPVPPTFDQLHGHLLTQEALTKSQPHLPLAAHLAAAPGQPNFRLPPPPPAPHFPAPRGFPTARNNRRIVPRVYCQMPPTKSHSRSLSSAL